MPLSFIAGLFFRPTTVKPPYNEFVATGKIMISLSGVSLHGGGVRVASSQGTQVFRVRHHASRVNFSILLYSTLKPFLE
jgi:hypothetical protein